MGLLEDYALAFKIVALVFVYYWLSSRIENRVVKSVILLAAMYYIFFVEWNLFGTIIFFSLLIMFTGVINFVMDMVFQKQTVEGHEFAQRDTETIGYLMGRFR